MHANSTPTQRADAESRLVAHAKCETPIRDGELESKWMRRRKRNDERRNERTKRKEKEERHERAANRGTVNLKMKRGKRREMKGREQRKRDLRMYVPFRSTVYSFS